MPQCPACQSTLEHDFGMITCGNCKAVLMVEIGGEVRVGSESPLPVDENTFSDGQVATSVDDDITEPPEENDASITEPNNFESIRTLDNKLEDGDEDTQFPNDGGLHSSSGFDPIKDDFDNVMEADSSDINEEAVGEVSVVSEDFLDDGEDGVEDEEEEEGFLPMEPSFVEEEILEAEESISSSDENESNVYEDEVVETFPMASEPDPNPVDITSYANSETSNLEDGEILYDIKVSRLDSKDLKDALKYVLIDEKLKLNYHEFFEKNSRR